MALKSQCFLPDGTARTGPVGATPASNRAPCPEDTRNTREEHASTAGLLCWAVLGLITKEPLPPPQTLLDAKPIATCTPQPSERPRYRSDSGFIFTGQHKMKCEEADKCEEHGAMVTSDIRSLAEQTAAGMISV